MIKKVSIIISNPEMGGAQRVSITLAEWLVQQNVYVNIIGLTTTSNPAYTFDNLDYIQLTRKPTKELRSVLRAFMPDVVLTMGVPLCVYTIPACIGLQLKHIVSERNDPASFTGKAVTKYASRLLMKLADGYVFQTKNARDYYGGNIAENSVIIPNPLLNAEKMPSALIEKRNLEIVSVGRLNKQKNHKLLISAFKRVHEKYHDLKLVIWGEGNERDQLQDYINRLSLTDTVTLPGNSSNVFKEIYRSKFFVLSSDFEGMPNALMEAMALGLPCISTKCPCGGPAELIKDFENGILVSVGNEDEMVKAMEYMLENESEAEKMGINAQFVKESYSIDSICTKWYSYFNSVI